MIEYEKVNCGMFIYFQLLLEINRIGKYQNVNNWVHYKNNYRTNGRSWVATSIKKAGKITGSHLKKAGKLTATTQVQHCHVSATMESLSRGGLQILSTILSPSSSLVRLAATACP